MKRLYEYLSRGLLATNYMPSHIRAFLLLTIKMCCLSNQFKRNKRGINFRSAAVKCKLDAFN